MRQSENGHSDIKTGNGENAMSFLLCTSQGRLVSLLIWCTSCLRNLDISHQVTAWRFQAKLNHSHEFSRSGSKSEKYGNNTGHSNNTAQPLSTRFFLSLLIIYLSAESTVHLCCLKHKYLHSFSLFKHQVCFRTDLRCNALFISVRLTVEILIKTAALTKSRQ